MIFPLFAQSLTFFAQIRQLLQKVCGVIEAKIISGRLDIFCSDQSFATTQDSDQSFVCRNPTRTIKVIQD